MLGPRLPGPHAAHDHLEIQIGLESGLFGFAEQRHRVHAVERRGREALGDALVTAEIFRVLLPRLADRGVHTLGEADAFCARATSVIRRQTAMGW